MAGLFSKSGLFHEAGGNGGGGGSDPHNLGWYETPTALSTAHPTAVAGDWAIVGSTDTVWVWDTDTSAWVDTDTKGQVTSVNNQTGAVTLTASDVGALPDNTHIPADPVQADWNEADSAALDYIKNKPTIPAAQVNSDWNANSGVTQILNKPTLGTMAAESANDYTKTANLATVATTGAYSDLSGTPTIPTVNNATLTITQGGVSKGTFTANAGTDVTIDVDAGGSSLPSQTGNAGKFLTTDGTDASWATVNALTNNATANQPQSYMIGTDNSSQSSGWAMTALGYNVKVANCGVAIGSDSTGWYDAVAIGNNSYASSNCVAIGRYAKATGTGTIIIGSSSSNINFTQSNSLLIGQIPGSNQAMVDNYNTSKGFYWAEGEWDSTASKYKVYKLFDSDGTIPTDRFTTTPSADGTYVPTLTISSGVATRTWGAAPSGGGAPTLTWYTVSTAGTTLTIADTSSAQLVKVYKNGLLLQPTEDYTISGTTLTTVAALVVGDKITTEVF